MLQSFRTLLKRGDDAEYDFDTALRNYIDALYAIFLAFFQGTYTLEQAKKQVKDEAAAAFVVAYYQGFNDGNARPTNRDRAWIVNRYAQELAYIDILFDGFQEKKELGLELLAYISLAIYHAGNYGRTLFGIYNQGKVRADMEVLLTLGGPDGFESCNTCQDLKGRTEPARWWIENDLIPGPETGFNYECKGFNCQHKLFDLTGAQYTL